MYCIKRVYVFCNEIKNSLVDVLNMKDCKFVEVYNKIMLKIFSRIEDEGLRQSTPKGCII